MIKLFALLIAVTTAGCTPEMANGVVRAIGGAASGAAGAAAPVSYPVASSNPETWHCRELSRNNVLCSSNHGRTVRCSQAGDALSCS